MGPSENLRRTAGYRDRELNETHPFFLTKREGVKGTEATTPRTTIGSPFSKHVLLSPALMGVLIQGGDIPRYGVLSLEPPRNLLFRDKAEPESCASGPIQGGSKREPVSFGNAWIVRKLALYPSRQSDFQSGGFLGHFRWRGSCFGSR